MKILGTYYVVDKCWMLIGIEKLDCANLPKFGKLFDIVLHGPHKVPIFVFVAASTLCFDTTMSSFQLRIEYRFVCKYHSALRCHELFNATEVDGHLLVKPKLDLEVYCNSFEV